MPQLPDEQLRVALGVLLLRCAEANVKRFDALVRQEWRGDALPCVVAPDYISIGFLVARCDRAGGASTLLALKPSVLVEERECGVGRASVRERRQWQMEAIAYGQS